MNRIEFGRLISSLRKEHFDEDGNSWTQEMLGQKTGLGGLVIGKIERGERKLLDEKTLIRLADALQLTSRERREFFLAATGVSNTNITRQGNDPEKVLTKLIDMDTYLPAFIIDQYCDLVAVNQAVIELMHLEDAGLTLDKLLNIPCGLNMLYFVFSDKAVKFYRPLMGRYWSNYTYQNMMIFRILSLRYRHQQYFTYLLRTFNKFRYFRRYWQEVYFEEKDHYLINDFIRLNSPTWGRLTFFSASITALTSIGELYLFMYVPATPDTMAAFDKITGANEVKLKRIGNWPQRPIPSGR